MFTESSFKSFYRADAGMVLSRHACHIFALIREASSVLPEVRGVADGPFRWVLPSEDFPVLLNVADYFFGMIFMHSNLPAHMRRVLGYAQFGLDNPGVWHAVAFERTDRPIRCQVPQSTQKLPSELSVLDAMDLCREEGCWVFEKVLAGCKI